MRDYAKKNDKDALKRKRSRRSGKSKFGLVLSIVVFAVFFIAGLFWLQHHPALNTNTSLEKLQPQRKFDLTPKPEVRAPAPRDHFDFYTMLPHQEVPVSNSNSSNTAERTKQAEHEYFLQIGAFADLSTADALKAKLILGGFTPKIQPKQNQGQVLYRVYLGPYGSAQEREQQKAALSAFLLKPAVDSHNSSP
jgi:cell division protein FtsN